MFLLCCYKSTENIKNTWRHSVPEILPEGENITVKNLIVLTF